MASRRDEVARAERELRFFQEQGIGAMAAPSSDTVEAVGDVGGGLAQCVICLETPETDVGVLPCGHCPGCAPCVRAWVAQSEACPTCRRPARPQDVTYVALGAEPPSQEGGAARAGPTTSVDPDEAERWGTKPAAIIAYLRRVLDDAGSRAIGEWGCHARRLPCVWVAMSVLTVTGPDWP